MRGLCGARLHSFCTVAVSVYEYPVPRVPPGPGTGVLLGGVGVFTMEDGIYASRYPVPERVHIYELYQNTTRYGSFAYAKPVLRYYDHVNVLLRYPYSLLLHRQLVPLLAPRVRLQTRRGRRARKQQQRLRQLAKAVRAPV